MSAIVPNTWCKPGLCTSVPSVPSGDTTAPARVTAAPFARCCLWSLSVRAEGSDRPLEEERSRAAPNASADPRHANLGESF